MKKSELKTGMVVEIRNGSKYLIVRDVETQSYGHEDFILSNNGGFLIGSGYDEDMKRTEVFPGGGSKEYDIMKVWSKGKDAYITSIAIDNRSLIWEREERKPASFMEAVKAYMDGMDVQYEIDGKRNLFHGVIVQDMIKQTKWYILD